MNGKAPFFSVVIPTYNRAEKLKRALESLLEQSCRDFEVLVCDDGSTDDTRAVVESFSSRLQISYLWEVNWGGPARPRNRGIEASRGEWICFLDADDWWYPEKLAKVLTVVAYADLVYHDFDVETDQGRRLVGKRSRSMTSPVFVDLMTRGCSIVTSSTCIRREILQDSGGFAENKDLVAIEDFDLWLRISRITERFLHLPESLGGYWVDYANISALSERYIARERLVASMYTGYLSPEDRDEAERLLAYKIGIARKYLGDFEGCKQQLARAMGSRQAKVRLYAVIYYLLAIMRSRYTIP